MQNKKWIRFVESFVLMPVLTISGSIGSIPQSNPYIVSTPPPTLSSQSNILANATLALNPATDETADEKALDQEAEAKKAESIDAYFKAHDMPLLGTGKKMVEEAEKNGLDWRLLAAIAVRESTGGKHDCIKAENNAFGWGSCKISFKSTDAAIETVARNLGGNNPNTAKHYSGKTTIEILRTYNPPSVVPRYAEQVMKVMSDIGDENITSTSVATL